MSIETLDIGDHCVPTARLTRIVRPEAAGVAPEAGATPAVTIRRADPDDGPALTRLAALDSQPVPAGPLLVAEVAGELWASAPLGGGPAVADPFRPTADLVALLGSRARQLSRREPRQRAGGLFDLARGFRRALRARLSG